ncbi:MAG TPA: hypothetical protein VFT50_14165 [Baekduia sp.]|nr:hypothetical protein [Baekduia sp.]
MSYDQHEMPDAHRQHRERVLAAAVRAGKITDAHLPEYRQMFDRDPVGTQSLIAQLAARGENQYAASESSRVHYADRQASQPVTASADVPHVDHTTDRPKRTAANLGADDSVLRHSEANPTENGQQLVPVAGGGYMTAEQAAKSEQERQLIESYDQTPGTTSHASGLVRRIND